MLLMILETVFNLTTPLRLLELADPAHPLLRKLLQVAPGTYNHSIQMGNLAEAAAEAIGADPLLARVGAYYHDIGKTVRPEYFVENQIYVDNPHDRMSANLSKLAITAHVRDGEHLGRVYGLPKPVVDIIRQHHGTSVLAFFYHKALESSKDSGIRGELPLRRAEAPIKGSRHHHAGRQRRGGRSRHGESDAAQDPRGDPGDLQAEGPGRTAGRVGSDAGRPSQDQRVVRLESSWVGGPPYPLPGRRCPICPQGHARPRFWALEEAAQRRPSGRDGGVGPGATPASDGGADGVAPDGVDGPGGSS